MSGILGTSHSKSKVIGRSQDTAKVWVRSNNSADMTSTFGVSSLADTGTGVITVTFLTAFPNTNYVGLVMTQDKSGNFMHFCRMAQQTTTTCTIENYQNNAAADGGNYHFAIFGE